MEINVLIIEDDSLHRKNLKQQVTNHFKCELFEAETGEKGLSIINENVIHIALVDINLPGMSGFEVVKKIKKISPLIQVLFITGMVTTDYIIQAIRVGALDFVPKPFDFKQLLFSLDRAKHHVLKNFQIPSTTILIAEDDELARVNLAEVIRDEGYEVFEAENGLQAIEIFSDNRIDIALLDVKMPKMTGPEALEKMKSFYNDFEAIILTGFSDTESAIQALRAGAFYYLKKPIDLDSLFLLIEKAEEKLQLKRALLYRNREIELMSKVINKITGGDQAIIKLNDSDTQRFQRYLNMIPISMLFIDSNYRIQYSNKLYQTLFSNSSNKIDDDFISNLKRYKIKITIENIKENINKTLSFDPGKTFVDHKCPDLVLSHIKLEKNHEVLDWVIMLIHARIDQIEE